MKNKDKEIYKSLKDFHETYNTKTGMNTWTMKYWNFSKNIHNMKIF